MPQKERLLTSPETEEQDSVKKALRRNANPARLAGLAGRAIRCVKTRGAEALWREGTYRVDLMTKGESWQFRADLPLKKELRAQRKAVFAKMPCISVVVPLYNTPVKFLRDMIKSMQNQSYRNWELVLVNASDAQHPEVSEAVKRVGNPRVVLCRLASNEGIASNTNIGFSEATGEYFALLDHDDTLAPNALYELVKAINETDAEFLYSDEIVLDEGMKHLGEYHFKPDFAPDTLRGCNYITHFAAFSRTLLEAVGGEDGKFNGAQDYDLFLRMTEKTRKIAHIPKVLYYWRRHAGSTANDIQAKPEAVEAGAGALRAHLARVGLDGEVETLVQHPGAYRIRYALQGNPLVSVLVANMDHIEDLRRCLGSLFLHGGHENFEVILIENNSTQPETMRFYEALVKQYKNVHAVRYQGAFNFSAINNFGAQYARGEHLLLLNNDVELLSQGFVREMLSYSQRPDVGAVGAKLYYPDDKIQHAGVFIGIGGSAGHNHKGHPRKSGGDMYRLCTTQNFSAVTGACMMVKTGLYQAAGGLDAEHFAVAYNDIDFCLRLHEKGFLNVMTPFAEGYHHESKSRGDDTKAGGEKQARYEAEKAFFQKKYAALLAAGDPYYNPHFTLLYENYGYK